MAETFQCFLVLRAKIHSAVRIKAGFVLDPVQAAREKLVHH